MVMKNRQFGSLVLGIALLGCQAQQKPQDVAVANAAAETQMDSSEGVVGPDEAFFAEYYLEQVFHYSAENSNPSWDSGSTMAVAQQAVSAFDFRANYTDSRIQLMVKSLYLQGDADGDSALSETEFSALKLDPTVLGANGERLGHTFESGFFQKLAGDDETVHPDECSGFLRDIGPTIKAMLDRSTAQEQRRGLEKSWENILGRYDADQNGKLSLQEQRDLRKDRALLINRITGE